MYLGKRLGYSILNSARSMFSCFGIIEGYDAGKHPLVGQYMEGVYNSNPHPPTRSCTWDTVAVVKYLVFILSKSLFDISRKYASSLAILCGQRGREILSVMDI